MLSYGPTPRYSLPNIEHLLGDLICKLVPHLEDETVRHLLAPLPALSQLLRDDVHQRKTLVRSSEPSAQAILQNLLKDAVALIHAVVGRDADHSNHLPRPDHSDVSFESSRAQRVVVEDEVVACSAVGTVIDCLTMTCRIVPEITSNVWAHCSWSDDERALVNQWEAFFWDGAFAALLCPVEGHAWMKEVCERAVSEVGVDTAASVNIVSRLKATVDSFSVLTGI